MPRPRSLSARRSAATAYGSPLFARAWRAAERCAPITGSGWRARARRLVNGRLLTWVYALILPRLTVAPSRSSAGRAIGDQFAFWNHKWRRERLVQGVLLVPDRFEDYMRGRHRQAVRTNVRAARRHGLTVGVEIIDGWLPGDGDDRRDWMGASRVECWTVREADGGTVAQAILSVDTDVALLHGLVDYEGNGARWLLHTAIVERLCGDCRVLLTNSHHALRVAAGHQHFQRLRGYEIRRLRRPLSLAALAADRRIRMAGLGLVTVTTMLLARPLAPAMGQNGELVLLWLTALVALRRLSNRAGIAAATACLGALAVAAIHGAGTETAPLRDASAGLIVDGLFAVIPRLTWDGLSAAPAGAAALLVSSIIARSAAGGSHLHHGHQVDQLLLTAAIGAVAAGVGWPLGRWLAQPVPTLSLAAMRSWRTPRQST